MKRFFLSGYYAEERITGIGEIKEVVNRFGFITDFKMFSDISISISVEIEERKIDALYDGLKSVMRLEDFQRLDSDSNHDCAVMLNVTFNNGTGDVRRYATAIHG